MKADETGPVFALGAVLLAIAGTRAIVDLMPDGNIWSGFGYVLAAVGLVAVPASIMWRTSK